MRSQRRSIVLMESDGRQLYPQLRCINTSRRGISKAASKAASSKSGHGLYATRVRSRSNWPRSQSVRRCLGKSSPPFATSSRPRSLHDDRFTKTTQKRLHSCVLAQTKGAKILEKLGDNAGNALKIVIPAAYPTAGLKTSAKTIIRNTILNYLGNIRSMKPVEMS